MTRLANSPRKEGFPIAHPYYTAWLYSASLNGYNTGELADSPIYTSSRSPTSEVNRTTGAVLPAGSMVLGTDGIAYVASTAGLPRALGFSGIAQTWTGLQTFGDGIATDTIAEETAAAGVTIDGVLLKDSGGTIAGVLTLADGSTLQRSGAGSAGDGDTIERIGANASEGMEVRVWESTVSPSAIETALLTLPANSVVDSVQANVQAALTGGGTTVTFGIGITGDVDCYGTAFSGGAPSNLLTQNAKINAIGTRAAAGAGIGVYNAATVAVKLIGAATGGTAAGDTALTVGSVRVVIRYRVLVSLANA